MPCPACSERGGVSPFAVNMTSMKCARATRVVAFQAPQHVHTQTPAIDFACSPQPHAHARQWHRPHLVMMQVLCCPCHLLVGRDLS